MQAIKEIRKYVKAKSKQGYEGYLDLLKYFSAFDKKQIEYIELCAKNNSKSFERLSSIKELLTIFIALFALIFSCLPESYKVSAFIPNLLQLGIVAVFVIVLYVVIDIFCSQNINISQNISGLI